jgi:hypothetical protein
VVPPSFGRTGWTDAALTPALSGGPGRLPCDFPRSFRGGFAAYDPLSLAADGEVLLTVNAVPGV